MLEAVFIAGMLFVVALAGLGGARLQQWDAQKRQAASAEAVPHEFDSAKTGVRIQLIVVGALGGCFAAVVAGWLFASVVTR